MLSLAIGNEISAMDYVQAISSEQNPDSTALNIARIYFFFIVTEFIWGFSNTIGILMFINCIFTTDNVSLAKSSLPTAPKNNACPVLVTCYVEKSS